MGGGGSIQSERDVTEYVLQSVGGINMIASWT